MPSKDFQVSIVGGGIVGLACAIGLARSGIQTDLFEAAPKYGEVGAGVGVGANAVRIIQKLGVLDAVVARSDDPEPKMRFFKFRRGVEPHDDIYHYPGEPQDIGLGLHRADFVDALASAVDPSRVAEHFGKRCVDITTAPSGRQIIHFADGTTHETDVVIGADGIKSSVRRLVVGEETSAKSLRFTNTLVYRGLVPVAELVHEGVKTDVLSWPVCWFGDDKHLITFPIKNSKVLNVVVFTTDYSKPMQPAGPQSDWSSWVQPATQEEMISHYSGWGPDVQALLRCIKKPSRWAVHGLYPPLESYTRGRIAIIGDAAHAMLPHLGSGAGAGIEDAYVLAQLLGHPQTNRNNLDAVLRVHSLVRVPRASFISLASKEAGEVYEGRGPAGGGDEGLLKDINLQWHEVWHHDIEDEIRQAENILVKEGAFTQTTP